MLLKFIFHNYQKRLAQRRCNDKNVKNITQSSVNKNENLKKNNKLGVVETKLNFWIQINLQN